MPFDTVYVVSDTRTPATADQIRAAETALTTHFPSGYHEYVTTLGAGYLNERVRVIPPTEIVEQTAEYRAIEDDLANSLADNGVDRWAVVERGLDLLPPERLLAAILLVDPGDGHRMVFHPDAPEAIFFIPHDDTVIYPAGHTLDEALTWFLETGPWGVDLRVVWPEGLLRQRPFRYFEPDRDYEYLAFDLKTTVDFPEVRSYLLTLAQRDPAGALVASEVYINDEDNTQHDVLHVFVPESGGVIWCNDLAHEQGSITLQLRYDPGRKTARLDDLIAFCRSRATHVTDNDQQVTML